MTDHLQELIAKAAALSVERGDDLDAWMRSVWNAYMEARPGYKEFLEEQQLKSQLEELRQAGKLASA